MKLVRFFAVVVLMAVACSAFAGVSVYSQKFDDERGVFFTEEAFGIKADGKMDVSDALQDALNKLKTERGFGTLYLPEGKYRISRTIYVPGSIRIVGYGKNRPEIVLGNNTPGFSEKETSMVWFTGGIVTDPNNVSDANAGTFYSGMSNVNIRIGKGNPMAIGLRTHLAQHGVLSHVTIYGGDGFACLYDAGNEMEDVEFFGARYGISSNVSSPSWPIAVVDVYFEGQKEAAIVSRNAGMAIVNMKVKNAPLGIVCEKELPDRLFLEDCYFENVGVGLTVTGATGATNQVSAVNVFCKNVPLFAVIDKEDKSLAAVSKSYKVDRMVYGLISNEMGGNADYDVVYEASAAEFPAAFVKTVPALPSMDKWVSVTKYGAVGDCETDDTQAIQKAIDENDVVFVPEGWYKITNTIKLRKGSRIIGLHPFATQFVLSESTPAFSGFGSPVAMVESSEGGDDIFTGIGICTGGYNQRAVGMKWMAGEKSLLNDVKFVGGHGTMARPTPGDGNMRAFAGFSFGAFGKVSSPSDPVAVQGLDQAWDNQYWSLWITNNGGGTFKNIWTANSYASSGLYVSHTSTPSRMYAISLEHHVRNESRWNDVQNYKIYAMQYEEESREGRDCVPVIMDNCKNLTFANTWFYRVVRVMTSRDYGFIVSNCENIQLYNTKAWTQVICELASVAYDMSKNISLYQQEFAYSRITGTEKSRRQEPAIGEFVKLGGGYEFAVGATSDSKGNVYFCEGGLKKIYKWDAQTGALSTLADFPYRPISLVVDTDDNLVVICRYSGQPGYRGETLTYITKMDGDNSNYSGWGNGMWAIKAYAIDLKDTHHDTMTELNLVPTSSVKAERIAYPSHSLQGLSFALYDNHLPQESYLAPDGKTLIPFQFDFCRSIDLQTVTPGQKLPVFITWEDPKATYKFNVNADGSLDMTDNSVRRGDYAMAQDAEGNLYLGEGQIYLYDKDFNEKARYDIEERPMSMQIGGQNDEYLFVTTNHSLYKMRIK